MAHVRRKYTVMEHLRRKIGHSIKQVCCVAEMNDIRYAALERGIKRPTPLERFTLQCFFANKEWRVLMHKVWINKEIPFSWPEHTLEANRAGRITKPSYTKLEKNVDHYLKHGYKFTPVSYPVLDAEFTLHEHTKARRFRAAPLPPVPDSWRTYAMTGRLDVSLVRIKRNVKIVPRYRRALLEVATA